MMNIKEEKCKCSTPLICDQCEQSGLSRLSRKELDEIMNEILENETPTLYKMMNKCERRIIT